MRRLLLVVPLLVLLLGSPASAVPTGGADPDTPGTGSSVSPTTLAAGELIRFTVTGFPAGEVVYVKIDDGGFCDQQGVHGACVVHQQRIGGDGSVSGSFLLPAELPVGTHWLRFLASEELTDAQGNYLGVKGYTRRGGAGFRVVAASDPSAGSTPTAGPTASSSAPPGGTPSASASALPGSTVPTALPTAGAVLAVVPGAEDAASAPSAPATPSTAPVPVSPVAAPVETGTRFPVIGVAGLAGLLLAAAALVLRSRRG